jgi:hypothetical protein
LSVEAAASGSGWTAGHDKEHSFQVKKRAKKELQALQDGVQLQHEIRPGMQEDLAEMTQRQAKTDAATKRKFMQRQDLRRTPKLRIKAGNVVCISVPEFADDLARVLLSKGCNLVDQLSLETQVLVVSDPASLEKSQKWIAALSGVLVCSAEAVLSVDSDNGIGPWLQFSPAIERKRKLHLTEEFWAKNGMISNLLRDACQLPGSHWTISAAAGVKGCTVLGGEGGKSAKTFLKSITNVCRALSRAR